MENQMHEDGCFITLTYDDNNLPSMRTLVKKDLTDFFKRLRKSLGDVKVRYFAVGEYGERFKRPHYHIILFGTSFKEDRKLYKQRSNPLYTSELLTRAWGKGFANFGAVSFESAAYCARYCLKKVNASKEELDVACDIETGEVFSRIPEFCVMSRRPGIGSTWYDKYCDDVRRTDFVVARGRRMKSPRFFDKLFERYFKDDFLQTKAKRVVDIEHRHVTVDEYLGLVEAEQAEVHLQSALSKRKIE